MCRASSSCRSLERSRRHSFGRGCYIPKGNPIMADKKHVLFLCTGNSARSQMAEGLLRHMAGDQFEIFSAGTHPKGMHPRSVDVMKEIGIDISTQTSKDVATFLNDRFDYVITVCDRAKQQ